MYTNLAEVGLEAYRLLPNLTGGTGPVPAPQLDVVMVVGFLSAVVAICCRPLMSRHGAADYVFASAVAALGGYCFVTGAWPAGLVAFVVAFSTLWSRAGRLRARLARWWWDGIDRSIPAVGNAPARTIRPRGAGHAPMELRDRLLSDRRPFVRPRDTWTEENN